MSIGVAAACWSAPGALFGLATVLSGSLAAGAGASLCGIVVAWLARRGAIAVLTNDRSAVAAGHLFAGSVDAIDAIDVFWRPGCRFAEGLGRRLDAAGVPTRLRDISENPGDAAIVRSLAAGNETVPTLLIGPVALVNPGMRLVVATLREHAPHLLAAHATR
jgi:mycoredoxin